MTIYLYVTHTHTHAHTRAASTNVRRLCAVFVIILCVCAAGKSVKHTRVHCTRARAQEISKTRSVCIIIMKLNYCRNEIFDSMSTAHVYYTCTLCVRYLHASMYLHGYTANTYPIIRHVAYAKSFVYILRLYNSVFPFFSLSFPHFPCNIPPAHGVHETYIIFYILQQPHNRHRVKSNTFRTCRYVLTLYASRCRPDRVPVVCVLQPREHV